MCTKLRTNNYRKIHASRLVFNDNYLPTVLQTQKSVYNFDRKFIPGVFHEEEKFTFFTEMISSLQIVLWHKRKMVSGYG